MLFNCLSCAKTISTKKNACAYCGVDITHLSIILGQEKKKNTFRERYRGTILSLVHRL